MQFIFLKFYPKSLIVFLGLFLAFYSNLFAETNVSAAKTALVKQTERNIANDNIEGEDLVIRSAAIKALGKSAGTIVVMNAQTGRIYTIVNQKWAIESGFKPCSTIKLVTGVAGFNENLIRNNGNLAKGSYRLGLDEALAYSNNAFFQKVGKNLGSKKMIYYSRQLGLGNITGINADNEYAGRLPYGNENLRIYSHADDFLVTPLQLSVMVSAITNGGKILVPRIPRSRREKIRFRGAYRSTLKFQPKIFERVIPGMMGAVKFGTARRIKNAKLNIAGKTGSCISRKTWVGLFASVAPIQNPKFSVVVITRGKFARGKHSAAIAEKIYQTLRPRYKERFNRNLARKTVIVKSKPKFDTETAAKSSAKKKSKLTKNTAITYKRKTNKKSPKIKMKKPKELFPTVVIKGKTEIVRPRVVRKQ